VPRPFRSRLAPLALGCALTALALAGCGSSAKATPTAGARPTAATATASAAASAPVASATGTGEPVASTAATPTDQLPVVLFVRPDGSTVPLPVEVPPRHEYGIGLSGRTTLSGRGMVFYYPNAEGNAGFWMKNTHVDLSIAFVDTSGHIIEIDEMQAESLTVHRPVRPYEFAIEAPSGWYAQQRIEAGDEMRLQFTLPDNILN
jgi:uncharacterized membrane protein (UPF0127 family)